MGKKEITLIFLLAFVLRLIFVSDWLEDWDSVQFALALHDFSIVKHQPHPPGYPLYILLGKVFYLIFKSDTKALTSMSVLFGSLTVFPIYLLAKEMFNKSKALLAALLFIVTPIGWSLSEVALTNIPGLFFLTVFAYFLYISANKPKKIVLVSFFAGIILGFRFTEFPVIVSLLVITLIRNRKINYIFYSMIAFLLGIFSWVLPLILVSGLTEFFESYLWIANYIVTHDTLLGQDKALGLLIQTRLKNLLYILEISYTSIFLIISSSTLGMILLHKKNRSSFKYQFLATWILSYSLPLIFVYNLEVPRYTLPLLPPLAIILASKLHPVLLIPLLFFVANQGASQVIRFKNSLPPTVAAVNFAKNNYDSKKVMVGATFTYRHFQYYAPELSIFSSDTASEVSIPDDIVVVTDHKGLEYQINGLSDFEITQINEFAGDRDIFSRIPKITLYVYEKPKRAK